jgi:hypothetical protein
MPTMAIEIRTSTATDASPEELQQILRDLRGYPDWHPLVERLVLKTEWSTRFKLRLRRPGRRSVPINGSVLELGGRFVWRGGYPLWGVLMVAHTVSVSPVSGDGSRFDQALSLSGLLAKRAAPAAEQILAVTGEALAARQQASGTVPGSAPGRRAA